MIFLMFPRHLLFSRILGLIQIELWRATLWPVILEGASDEERSLFLTVLQHGVVLIDGQEDVHES